MLNDALPKYYSGNEWAKNVMEGHKALEMNCYSQTGIINIISV